VIEWPEKVQSLIPKSTLKINFEFVDETTRKATIDSR
jgi:tRNA A37 threonylcarbamoyladenosine biosynthesis protein TsaE